MLVAYWYGSKKPFPKGRELGAVLRSMKAHGVRAFMPQWGLDNARRYCEDPETRRICDAEGMVLYLGLGLDRGKSSPSEADHLAQVERAIKAALDLAGSERVYRVSYDWEGWWEGRQRAAAKIAAAVLDAHPDAAHYGEDCPWWAPQYFIDTQGRKRWTHPHAPTIEFGQLVQSRYVQAYGAQADGSPDGRSLSMLRWSRAPSQYPALGTWAIRPTTQLYARSLNDHVRTLLAEPEQRLWAWNEMDPRASLGLRVVEALRLQLLAGENAVLNFQRLNGLDVDNVVGPQTLAALGLGPKAAKQ